MSYSKVDQVTVNTIRLLAVDATRKANSGHPGAPMGLAPVAHVLFNRFMKFNPKNPHWINRDRFVLSNGHSCMLQYAILHLYGYAVTMDDLKQFRQLGSITPGHPELHDTPGIEVTTGPLGQGIANAVGLAIAQQHLSAVFNRPNYDLITNHTYVFLGDGCLMEGVSAEAISLAGHLRLGNLIAIYDDNHVSIDGDTAVSFTDDTLLRFESYGWHTLWVKDGNDDLAAIQKAIQTAKDVTDRPSLIRLTTTIGFGSELQGTHDVHGNPLKDEDTYQVKVKFGFNPKDTFVVPPEVYKLCHEKAESDAKDEHIWNSLLERYSKEYPDLYKEFKRRLENKLPDNWAKSLPVYKPSDPPQATRKLSEAVIEAIHSVLPEFISGSADLTGSNNTRWKEAVDFQCPKTGLGDWSGRYMRYGVREHGMSAIMNGMSAYGMLIPAGGTFLNFVSYAAGAVRLSALSHLRVIYIATHDSIGLGEDGPTHQPIETLAHFRALPNMMVWRPADGNETSGAYYKALSTSTTPSIIALTRQNLPHLENSSIENTIKGGYIVYENEKAVVALVSTGSEVSICIDAAKLLEANGTPARVVSLPCTFVFDAQPMEYKLSVLKPGVPTLSVEVMTTLGWQKYSHEQFGLDRFGASGPYKKLYEKFEFTPEGIMKRALATVNFWKDVKPLHSPIQKAFEQLK